MVVAGTWFRASLLAVLVGAGLVGACRQSPDDARIRDTIGDIVTAVEKHSAGGVLDHIARTYRDHEGRDIAGLRQLLLGSFLRYPNIHILVTGHDVAVRGDRAESRLAVQLTSGKQVLADRQFGSYRVHLLWERQSREWVIYFAEWENLAVSGASG